MRRLGKIQEDLARAVALGGDCLADVGILRAEPDVFGSVASDPTVSRLIDALAASGPKALAAIRAARSEVRGHIRDLAGTSSPAAEGRVIVDIDGVLVLAHSARPNPERNPTHRHNAPVSKLTGTHECSRLGRVSNVLVTAIR